MGCLLSQAIGTTDTSKEGPINTKSDTTVIEPISGDVKSGKGRTQSQYVKKSIPKRTRDLVWVNNNGEVYAAPCYCCNRRIDVTNFEAGHVKAEREGGLTTLQNLLPVCSQCNRSMATENMISFAQRQGYPGRVIKLSLNTIGSFTDNASSPVKASIIQLNIIK